MPNLLLIACTGPYSELPLVFLYFFNTLRIARQKPMVTDALPKRSRTTPHTQIGTTLTPLCMGKQMQDFQRTFETRCPNYEELFVLAALPGSACWPYALRCGCLAEQESPFAPQPPPSNQHAPASLHSDDSSSLGTHSGAARPAQPHQMSLPAFPGVI